MRLLKTKINGPLIIKSKIFKDDRGFFRETFKNDLLKNLTFPFDVMSSSRKNVLRGLHIQTNYSQAKVVTVTNGKIFDVAVDLRQKSNTFGKYVCIIISDKSDFSFYIPSGFAHGFMCLSKKCTVHYKCSNYRDKQSEETIMWNDDELNIKWPFNKPILSKKDTRGLSLIDYKKLFLK